MLYDGLYDRLVRRGVVSNLAWGRLPEKQGLDVVQIAVKPLTGLGATKYLGSTPIHDPERPYLSHDSGVLWFHTGLLFEARSPAKYSGLFGPMDSLNNIRDDLLQLVDGEVTLPDLGDVNVVQHYRDLGWIVAPGETSAYGRPPEPETLYWAEVTNPPNLLEQDQVGRLTFQLIMEIRHKTPRS